MITSMPIHEVGKGKAHHLAFTYVCHYNAISSSGNEKGYDALVHVELVSNTRPMPHFCTDAGIF